MTTFLVTCAVLFLVVGAIDHCAGTRDTRKLAGLAYGMPIVAIAAFMRFRRGLGATAA